MKTSVLTYTCICLLALAAFPLVVRAGGDTNAVTYANVWAQKDSWRSFDGKRLVLYSEIILEKSKQRDVDNTAQLNELLWLLAHRCTVEDCRELDEKFSSYNLKRSVDLYPVFPKTAERYMANNPDEYPQATLRHMRSKPSLDYSFDIWSDRCGQDMVVQLYCYNHYVVSEYYIDFYNLRWTLSQGVEKYVEEHGGIDAYLKKSVNPYVELSEKITALENSRKLNGIAQLFMDYGGVEWIEPTWPTEADVNKYMADLLDGTVSPLNSYNGKPSKELNMLRLYLGLEKYNEFVKRYNIHASGAFGVNLSPKELKPAENMEVIEGPHKRWGHHFEFASRADFADKTRAVYKKAGNEKAVKHYTDLITWSVLQSMREGHEWVDDPEMFD